MAAACAARALDTRRLSVIHLKDFVLEPRGPRLIDAWKHLRGGDTSLGRFDFECIVDMDEKPDEQMVAGVRALFEFVHLHQDQLMDALHEHYVRFSRHEEWMESCGVPLGLPRSELRHHLRSRSVCASRHG